MTDCLLSKVLVLVNLVKMWRLWHKKIVGREFRAEFTSDGRGSVYLEGIFKEGLNFK